MAPSALPDGAWLPDLRWQNFDSSSDWAIRVRNTRTPGTTPGFVWSTPLAAEAGVRFGQSKLFGETAKVDIGGRTRSGC